MATSSVTLSATAGSIRTVSDSAGGRISRRKDIRVIQDRPLRCGSILIDDPAVIGQQIQVDQLRRKVRICAALAVRPALIEDHPHITVNGAAVGNRKGFVIFLTRNDGFLLQIRQKRSDGLVPFAVGIVIPAADGLAVFPEADADIGNR